MKFIKLIVTCFLGLVLFCSIQKTIANKKNMIPNQFPGYEGSDSSFIKIYTMTKKDSGVIGDIFVKFENDTLFRYLYLINKDDTLFSIKKNIFRGKNKFEAQMREDVHGYTFNEKGTDYFYLNLWNENGEALIEFPIYIEWDYNRNAAVAIIP